MTNHKSSYQTGAETEIITPVHHEDFAIPDSWRMPASYRRGHKYAPIIAGLDVETSTMPDYSFAWVYLWCMAFRRFDIEEDEETIVYGRTGAELKRFLNRLADAIGLTLNYRIAVYIHNAKFDLSFLKLDIDLSARPGERSDFIARSTRQIIRCNLEYLYEMRDSAVYTEMPLEMMGHEIGLLKLSEDYAQIRTPETPLAVESLQYCGRDAQILARYYAVECGHYGGVGNTPLTATGKVERCITECFTKRSKFWRPGELARIIGSKQLKTKFKPSQKKPTPTEKDLQEIERDRVIMSMLRSAFFGGYCYADDAQSGCKYHNLVASADIDASYASVMLTERFPVDRFLPYDIPRNKAEEMQMMLGTGKYTGKALLIHVKFYGLKARIKGMGVLPSWIRFNLGYNGMIRNKKGTRIEYVSEIELILTDVDYRQIVRFYTCQGIEIIDVMASNYGGLPEYITDAIILLYVNKQAAKSEIKKLRHLNAASLEDEIQYMRKKTMVARMYGVFVKDPMRMNYDFDPEKHIVKPLGVEQADTNFYDKVLYQWGVWVAAHARARLLDMIVKIGTVPDGDGLRWTGSVIYADTDCARWIVNEDDAERISMLFAFENEKMRKKMRAVLGTRYITEFHTLYDIWLPRDILDRCGSWDIERYQIYKQIGLKQYCAVDEDGNFKSVIAGLPKPDYRETDDGETENVGMSFFDQFETNEQKVDALTEELFVPSEQTSLLASRTFEGHHEAEIEDCTGVLRHVSAECGTVLVPVDYTTRKKGIFEEMQEGNLAEESAKIGVNFYDIVIQKRGRGPDISYWTAANLDMQERMQYEIMNYGDG